MLACGSCRGEERAPTTDRHGNLWMITLLLELLAIIGRSVLSPAAFTGDHVTALEMAENSIYITAPGLRFMKEHMPGIPLDV